MIREIQTSESSLPSRTHASARIRPGPSESESSPRTVTRRMRVPLGRSRRERSCCGAHHRDAADALRPQRADAQGHAGRGAEGERGHLRRDVRDRPSRGLTSRGTATCARGAYPCTTASRTRGSCMSPSSASARARAHVLNSLPPEKREKFIKVKTELYVCILTFDIRVVVCLEICQGNRTMVYSRSQKISCACLATPMSIGRSLRW